MSNLIYSCKMGKVKHLLDFAKVICNDLHFVAMYLYPVLCLIYLSKSTNLTLLVIWHPYASVEFICKNLLELQWVSCCHGLPTVGIKYN